MHLLCGGSEVLKEKKEEQSSNTSTGRSCSPLCPAGGHICWFLGPKIINFSAVNSRETWEMHTLTKSHKHKHVHKQTYIWSYVHGNRVTHTETVLHNKWWHCNCYVCLFTSGCNGWSFFTWQPIRVRQEVCELLCKSRYILTIWHIHNNLRCYNQIHSVISPDLNMKQHNMFLPTLPVLYLCSPKFVLMLFQCALSKWLMITSSVIGSYFGACLLSQWGAPSILDIHHCFTALRKEVSCCWLLCSPNNRHIPIEFFFLYFFINEHLMFGLLPAAFREFLRSTGDSPES